MLQRLNVIFAMALISTLAIPALAQTQAEATINGVQVYPYVGWGNAVPQETLYFPGNVKLEPLSAAQWVPRGGPEIITAAVTGPVEAVGGSLPVELLIFSGIVLACSAVLYVNGRRKHIAEPATISGG